MKTNSRFALGLDIGSVAAKAVVWDLAAGAPQAFAERPTGWEPERAGRQCLAEALRTAGISDADDEPLVVTGYGRSLWRGKGQTSTEVNCLARGIGAVVPEARTVFDIGGQDSKVLLLDSEGRLASFAINDRCAAGTGRFLEMAALRLGLTVEQLGESAQTAAQSVRLSSLCAVFAESEIVGLLMHGAERAKIARGLCEAVARQMLALAGSLDTVAPFALVGGVARSLGVRAALERELGQPVLVPEKPQMVVALGAALMAAELSD